jgi:hypothetical protein
MRFRSLSCHCLVGALAIVVTVADTCRADDPATVKQLQETVTKLEKKIADLEAKVAALEKQAKADPGAKPDKNDEEYVKQKAGAVLDALLAGDASGVRGLMTQKLLKGINSFWTIGSLNHNSAVDEWISDWNPKKQYKSHTIDKVAFSPAKDEVVIQGSLTAGKDYGAKGTFTMTLVKEKDKYMLDACSQKAK